MRLLHATSLKFQNFFAGRIPPYAILSHTWDEKEEVTLQDMASPYLTAKKGFGKIAETCRLARERGLEYAWIDTCCIDKTNNTELTESINSMFRWYQQAAVCVVYLEDLAGPVDVEGLEGRLEGLGGLEGLDTGPGSLARCNWFRRGWTLQELLAPRAVEFYDGRWARVGSRTDLARPLAAITRIPEAAVVGREPLDHYSAAQRMAWASRRVTTQVEDAAYCLLGLFDVNMPLIYGEGPRAFQRLQEEIVKRTADLTLFAWTPVSLAVEGTAAAAADDHLRDFMPLLASSPAEFAHCHALVQFRHDDSEFAVTNRGLRLTTYLVLVPLAGGAEDGSHVDAGDLPADADDHAAGGPGRGTRSSAAAAASRSGPSPAPRRRPRYRYVLSVGNAQRDASEMGIWLRKIGPGLFLREAADQPLALLSKAKLRAIDTTENHTFFILLHPRQALAASAQWGGSRPTRIDEETPPPLPPRLQAIYHPRMLRRGLHIPDLSDRAVFLSSIPPSAWDERTRIFCQPASRNDVVAFSCSSRQGPGGCDNLSFGVLVDYRPPRRARPLCRVVNRHALESRFLFVLAMRPQDDAAAVRWHVLENELPGVAAAAPVLRMPARDASRAYDVAATVVDGRVPIDDVLVDMHTLDISIASVVR